MASAPELPDYSDPPQAVAESFAPARGIASFARGARAGTCLHEILEHCDFTRVADSETAKLVADVLRKHRLDDSRAHKGDPDPVKTVCGMLADLTGTELPGAGFTLASVKREARLNEWQFYLSMASLSQRRLARCFAEHGSGEIASIYPAMLESLGERDVRGFLMGFVDLVFTHDERWYLIDWKSNHLGADPRDYDDVALARVMRDDHYVLQYHLYALALDRYLRQRMRGYAYDQHFGGVYYAFLRGIRPGMRTGWYVDRPSRELLGALDALLREGSAS
jgi:exodeoxyribonuclease V beta subunit